MSDSEREGGESLNVIESHAKNNKSIKGPKQEEEFETLALSPGKQAGRRITRRDRTNSDEEDGFSESDDASSEDSSLSRQRTEATDNRKQETESSSNKPLNLNHNTAAEEKNSNKNEDVNIRVIRKAKDLLTNDDKDVKFQPSRNNQIDQFIKQRSKTAINFDDENDMEINLTV